MSDCDDWDDDPAPPANDDGYRGNRGGDGNRGLGGGGRFNNRGGGGSGGKGCFKCGEDGHMSWECPQGGGGGGGGMCYNCQQTGHMSRECVNEKVERPRRSYGESGGGWGRKDMSRDCSRGGGVGGVVICFKCQESGHIARKCLNERKEPPPRPTENGVVKRKENWKGTGINFSKYKNIAVKVTGENAPAPVDKFEDMGLLPLVLDNVKFAGYTEPTPIQKFAIPIILNCRDLMACAQTGSGKTGAYLLPIITHLLNIQSTLDAPHPQSPVAHPYVLILAPTRELAIQIHKEGNIYANESIIKVKVLYEGTQTGHARDSIRNGCHILVATPGRLKQFIKENVVSLERLMFFVLVEADRMLDMRFNFKGDIEEIIKTVPKGVQISLFSETFPEDIQAMAAPFLTNYLFVTVETVGRACSDVEQHFLQVPRSDKRDAVLAILKDIDYSKEKILIFVGSKLGADFLYAYFSYANISATSIHRNRLQSQRETALREFTSGRHGILVATSEAAHGLDIPQVTLVINYDLPTEIDEYVHRIRTGRVGHNGRVLSLFDPESPNDPQIASKLIRILKDAGQGVPEFLENYAGSDELFGFASSDIRKGPANVEASTGAESDDEWD